MLPSNNYTHEFQDILIKNETYLRSIQRAGISIYNLGFEDLEFQSLEQPTTPHAHSTSLRAIIPREDQADFLYMIDKSLRKAGVFSPKKSKHALVDTNNKHKKHTKGGPASPSSRPSSAKAGMIPEEDEGEGSNSHSGGGGKAKINMKDWLPPKWEPKTTVPLNVNCARPINRTIQEEEAKKKLQAEIAAEKKKWKKLGQRFDLVDGEGEKYCYDYHGRKMAEDEYERRKEEQRKQEEIAKRKVYNGPKFTGAIIEKTSKYVAQVRERVAQVSVIS